MPWTRACREFFKEFQVAPKGIKKLISLPKETLNSNVKTRTWKSPSPKRTSSYKADGGGENPAWAAASDADSTVLSLQLVITFPAKDSLLPLSASKLRGGMEQEWDVEQKAFLFCFFLNFRWLTGKDLWMVSLEETKKFAISFSWNKWIESKLTSKGQLGFSLTEKRCYFSFIIHWEKQLSISYLSSLYSTCRPVLHLVRAQWLQTLHLLGQMQALDDRNKK